MTTSENPMLEDQNKKDLRERKKLSTELWFYSIQRIDLLIISISGAGIYITLETLKYLVEKNLIDSLQIKLAGGFFVVAIIVNFISQFTGQKANEKDVYWCNSKIKYGENPTPEQAEEIDKYDNSANKFTKWTNNSNLTSLVLMGAGLILLMHYFLFIF